jgi:hypothetical protein
MSKLRDRMVDRLIEAYVSWREACLQVSDTYGCWASERGTGATLAFASYMTALDREENAAEAYASLVRRASRIVSNEHDAAEPLGGPAWGVGWR